MTELLALTDAHRRAYDAHYARAATGEDAKHGAREGEALWHLIPGQWSSDEMFDLKGAGLIEVREEWKHNYVSFPDPPADERDRIAALLRDKSTREAVDDPAVREAFGFTEEPHAPR